MIMGEESDQIPTEGYLGTSKPRSGRQIPLPKWVAALVSEGEILDFSYQPEKHIPVFSPNPSTLRYKASDQGSGRWSSVGQNPVRTDDDVPVVQLPARFFSDYQGPQTAIPLEPVEDQAQIDPDRKLHFVIGWPSFARSFQCFLLTTDKLAQTDSELLPTLFADHRQRSLILDNLEGIDMQQNSQAVATLFQRLSGVIG